MSNSNNSRDTNRRVRRRLYVPLNLTKYRKNAKNITINHNSINVIPPSSSMNLYTNIPNEIGSFTQLERFSLLSHMLTRIPKEIGRCTNLKKLILTDNELTSIPKEIGKLEKLEELVLWGNNLTKLPDSIGNLKNLKELDLGSNKLTSLPDSIGNLKKLEILVLNENKLTSIPKEIGLLKNLKKLSFEYNNLTSIPKEIGLCKNLKDLDLSGNNLTSLPKEIEDLPKLSKLNLRFNPNLEGISSELRKRGLTIWKSSFTKFINYKYYTNQLSTVTVLRKNLPRIPPKIRENIARKVNTKPNTKNEGNKMNVARSSLRAYNNKQKVLTRRAENLISNRKQKLALAQKTLNNLNKINNNFKMAVSKVHNNASTKLIKKMINTNNKNTKTRKLLSN